MVSIRPVRDSADLARAFHHSLSESPPAAEEWFKPGTVSLVASAEEDLPVGTLLLLPDRRVAATILSYKLAWLCVAESHRRQGVARALLRAAAQLAAKSGAKSIQVPLCPSNTGGIALFDSLDATGGSAYVVHLKHGGF